MKHIHSQASAVNPFYAARLKHPKAKLSPSTSERYAKLRLLQSMEVLFRT